jgi:hypothetical protein
MAGPSSVSRSRVGGLGEHLGINPATASQTYYAYVFYYFGCAANSDLNAELFGDELALTPHATPTRVGS